MISSYIDTPTIYVHHSLHKSLSGLLITQALCKACMYETIQLSHALLLCVWDLWVRGNKSFPAFLSLFTK